VESGSYQPERGAGCPEPLRTGLEILTEFVWIRTSPLSCLPPVGAEGKRLFVQSTDGLLNSKLQQGSTAFRV